MCGIGALILHGDSILTDTELRNFTDAFAKIKHRGPDSSQYSPFKNGIVGHHRLSIVERTQAADQPYTVDGRYTCAFNGEIYNYHQLQNLLSREGTENVQPGDGGVILPGYARFGLDFFSRINGMYSIIIFDHVRQELILARDRYGIKPLFYSLGDETLVFSEIKSFLSFDKNKFSYIRKELNTFTPNDALTDFKLVSNLNIVKPGEVIVIKTKKGSIQKHNIDFDQHTDKTEFHVALNSALSTVTNTDLKIGAPFSGGIDSSLITCWINANKDPNNLLAVSIYSQDAKEEEVWRKDISKKNGFLFDQLNISEYIEDANLYNKFLKQCDIPPRSMSFFAQFVLYSYFKKNGVRVTIDGQGADELFCGYTKQSFQYVYQNTSLVQKLREILYHRWLLKDVKTLLQFLFRPRKMAYNRHMKQMHFGHLQYLVHFLDINSSYSSVEARVPYLTNEATALSNTLTPLDQIKNGYGKYLIRYFAERYMGKYAWIRKKYGFRAGSQLPTIKVLKSLVSIEMLQILNPSIKNWEDYEKTRTIASDWTLVKLQQGHQFID